MNPFYFGSSTEALFGAYHPPGAILANETAVLLCPPFMREYIRTHWSLRRLADQLAKAGCHVLRFDYYGTGDSAGDATETNAEKWRQNIATAVDELLDLSGINKVAIVGLRGGAALAASCTGLTVDRIVMWDPVINGKEYVAGMQQMHVIKLIQYNQIRANNLIETPQELLGFPFPDILRESIEALDLLDDFQIDATNVNIVTSSSQADAQQMAAVLTQTGKHVSLDVVPDVGDWDLPTKLGEAFLPNTILNKIVDKITGK